jgi:hypothetical protein
MVGPNLVPAASAAAMSPPVDIGVQNLFGSYLTGQIRRYSLLPRRGSEVARNIPGEMALRDDLRRGRRQHHPDAL